MNECLSLRYATAYLCKVILIVLLIKSAHFNSLHVCACLCVFVAWMLCVYVFLFLHLWLRPQPYRSLKEAELVEEGVEVGECFQGNTAPSSPVLDKFSDLSLLQDAFRSQQGEPECTETTNTTKPSHSTHSTLSSARSLEELRADPQHANFNYQVRSCCKVLGVTDKILCTRIL